MVSTRPSEPMTTPWPMRSVPSTEAVNASSGTSECTCTTDWSAASRLKRRFSCRGCRRSGKAHSVVSAMNRFSAVARNCSPILRRGQAKVTAGQEHTSANENTVAGPSAWAHLRPHDDGVRNLIVHALPGFLVNQDRIDDELVQQPHVGQQHRQAVDHVAQQEN